MIDRERMNILDKIGTDLAKIAPTYKNKIYI